MFANGLTNMLSFLNQEPMQKILGTTLLTSRVTSRKRRRPLFKKHIFCYVPLIKNLAAILSNNQLEEHCRSPLASALMENLNLYKMV